jgi:murein DD-endopeptidase MepM/ murein hydrolase activator NlpD
LEQTAQTLIAALLLGTASGCATFDDGRYGRAPVTYARPSSRPVTASSVHTVVPGDTVYSIARSYGVSPYAIIDANRLPSPDALEPGERLTIPGAERRQIVRAERERVPTAVTRSDLAPPQQSKSPPVLTSEDPRLAGARYYAAEPRHKPGPIGEGGPEFASARAVEASDARDTVYQPPRASRAVEREAESDPDDEAFDSPRRQRVPERRVASIDPADEAYDAPRRLKPAAPNSDVKALNRFVWPVRGQIISTFGKRASGVHNDGINIAAEPGSSVKAAEGGVVVYAGNELAGYGNLLLIRHSNGFVTAYAHNKKLLVGRGDSVRQGQAIATVGSTGDVDRPQLHFEIRKGDRAVDPSRYLERANASL